MQDYTKDTPLMKLIENINFSKLTKYRLIKKILRCPQDINKRNMVIKDLGNLIHDHN